MISNRPVGSGNPAQRMYRFAYLGQRGTLQAVGAGSTAALGAAFAVREKEWQESKWEKR